MRPAALAIACLFLFGRGATATEAGLVLRSKVAEALSTRPAKGVTFPGLADNELLQSARLWEARQRGDLARLALEKLVNTQPDSPDALLELGELNLRMSDFSAADQVSRQLEQRFPNSAAARSMSVQYRLATRDRLDWLSVQRLAQLGKGQEVRQALERLFPQGAPEGFIALEYYRLLADTPAGREPALLGLQTLASKYPHDPRYQEALRRLQPLASATIPTQRPAAPARPSATRPVSERPTNPAALAAASIWEQRSGAANGAQQLQLASLQLQAATALRSSDFEALIGVADALDSLGFGHQAGELLTTGSHLAPNSTWLFETRIRWLIAHESASQALTLLDSRPLDERWTTSRRDSLRASALNARARANLAASNEDAAIDDLKQAVELQPTDPWMRHRLATLLARHERRDQGREVMDQGAALAPDNPQMRFAQALYLESTDDPSQAFAAIDSVPAENRDSDMNAVRDRVQLSVISNLIEAGDSVQARAQLAEVRARSNPDDVGVQLNIAYREWSLGNRQAAAEIATRLASIAPERADIAMLAARAHHSQRRFGAARDYFIQAEHVGDADTVLSARQSREQIETRLHNWMSVGSELHYKPGDAGISRFEAVVIPTLWHYALDYERRLWVQADAVSIDAGKLSGNFDQTLGFGSIRAAGPLAARRYANEAQDGLALGLGYVTDTFAADLGSTPLGFDMSQLVGGVEWRPAVPNVAMSLGFSRRSVTSSVLSYASMRDPISGTRWGAVVQTGPYADAGIYRERYSLAAALRFSELTGEHVLDNQFFGARAAADWKFFSEPYARAALGLAVNYWQFDHNLQNYTLGSGGYYSPQSYVSVALPLEVWGEYRDWSYRLRASIAHSQTRTEAIALYPKDPALQGAVASASFGADRGRGTSFSAYAALERQLSPAWIVGMKLDIDRADYYHPTVFMIYLRHALAPWTTRIAVPPRPVQPYNEK